MRAPSPVLAAAAFAVIAGVWLNQSVGLADWEAFRDRTAPSAIDAIRAPFMFLYRRSHDEEIYYASASAMVGRPFPREYLDRGSVPDAFARLPATDDGRWRAPYEQVPFEYPPAVLPFVVAPRLVASSSLGYARVFDALMAACLTAACAIVLRARAMSAPDSAATKRWGIACLLLLAHGAIAVQRLDAVVALWLACALGAAVRRKPASLGAWIGLAAATKVTPALLFPIVLAADWPFYRQPKNLWRAASAFAAVVALGFAPLLLVRGGANLLAYHASRGLHVESTLGILYGAVAALVGRHATTVLDYGSFNVTGSVPSLLAHLATPLTLGAVVVLALALARNAPPGEGDRNAFPDEGDRVERIAATLLAGCAALWLAGKVLSPQYFTWAIPLVLAFDGGLAAVAWTFGAVLAVSQLYWRAYYDFVYGERALGLVTMVVRQALLAAVFVLSWRLARRPMSLERPPGDSRPA